MPSDEQLWSEWRGFLHNASDIVVTADPDRTHFPVETGDDPRGLAEQTDAVVRQLTGVDAEAETRAAFGDLDERVRDALFDEIRLFNSAIDRESGVGTLHEADLATRVETVTTVKDSVRNLLPSLPGWLDGLLEVLDELLDLVPA